MLNLLLSTAELHVTKPVLSCFVLPLLSSLRAYRGLILCKLTEPGGGAENEQHAAT